MAKVLVTGGSGFIGGHCLLQLLAAGHAARATVRNIAREPEVREALKRAGAENVDDRLSFVAADLERDEGWARAAEGCDYVLHVASPFPASLPKHEDDLIIPAREGALRVLRAARDAGVKRVVMTSSFAAVGYGHANPSQTFDETAWTNTDGPGVQPYAKSKTLAERAGWDFIAREGGGLELATVNPVGVFGPVLGADYSTSILMIQRLMDGSVPGCPRLWFGAVDVRDVADLHLRAMTAPAAAGERFLSVSGDFMSMLEMARALKADLGPLAKRVPTREIPDFLVRLIAAFDAQVRQITPELGKHKNATSAKARSLLGWAPRSREEAVVATAKSLLEQGLLKSA